MAIIYGVERFHQFTYGRPVVTVESDHKPLEVIHQKPLSVAPRRLQKMMMRLHHYDVTIGYKKGPEDLLADTLSRHHLESCNDEACSIENDFEWTGSLDTINQILACETTAAKLRDETRKDQELQQVKSYIYKGWPGNAKCLTPNITPYFHIRDELTIQDGLVFSRRTLRKQMLLEFTKPTFSPPRNRINNTARERYSLLATFEPGTERLHFPMRHLRNIHCQAL